MRRGSQDAAALVAVADVGSCEEVTADREWTQEQLEERIEAWTRTGSIPSGRAMPVLIERRVRDPALARDRPAGAPDLSLRGIRIRIELSCTDNARVVGLFSTQHEGVLSHHGQKLHLHGVVDVPGGAGSSMKRG